MLLFVTWIATYKRPQVVGDSEMCLLCQRAHVGKATGRIGQEDLEMPSTDCSFRPRVKIWNQPGSFKNMFDRKSIEKYHLKNWRAEFIPSKNFRIIQPSPLNWCKSMKSWLAHGPISFPSCDSATQLLPQNIPNHTYITILWSYNWFRIGCIACMEFTCFYTPWCCHISSHAPFACQAGECPSSKSLACKMSLFPGIVHDKILA